MKLDLALIEQASAYLRGKIRETPTEKSDGLSELTGTEAHFKLENLQTTGSFKLRGAFFRLSLLDPSEQRKGIIAASAGNHGLGLAHAGRELGIKVSIYVPSTVDLVKLEGIKKLGAEVIKTDYPGFDEMERFAISEAKRQERVFISAYDDEAIMAANGGSLAAEVIVQIPSARNFVLPVGGGGLSAGFSFYIKQQFPAAKIYGCQLKACPALEQSLKLGRAVTEMEPVQTRAGGLEGGIGIKTFEILKQHLDATLLVSESEINEAVKWCLSHHRYLVEPSAAVVIGACLSKKFIENEAPTCFILSGRNIAYPSLMEILKD